MLVVFTEYTTVVFSRFRFFSTNKTDRHNITEILLNVALNTITQIPQTDCNFISFIPNLVMFYPNPNQLLTSDYLY